MTDTTDRLAERDAEIAERDRQLAELDAADPHGPKPGGLSPLHRRLGELIREEATSSGGSGGPIRNANSVAAAILADTELCAAIAEHAPAKLREDAEGQIDAIDIVLAHLDDYRDTGRSRWGNLRVDLAAFRKRVVERRDQDAEVGAAFIAAADNDERCQTPAGVGGLIRAAIAKTGMSITDDRPRLAASEGDDRG